MNLCLAHLKELRKNYQIPGNSRYLVRALYCSYPGSFWIRVWSSNTVRIMNKIAVITAGSMAHKEPRSNGEAMI